MPIDIKKGFDDQDYLWDIRRNLINPVTVKVASLDDKMSVVEPLAKAAYTHLDVDMDNKRITFFSDEGNGIAYLDGMFKEGFDLTVQGNSGSPVQEVNTLKYKDGTVSRVSPGLAEVAYDWPKLVGDNQKDLQVGTIGGGTRATKHLFFKGAKDVVYTAGDITTIDLAAAGGSGEITATIPGKGQTEPVKISTIELEGDSQSSVLEAGKLTIHLNSGGGGVAPVLEDNFKGFFETLGDIESQITNPVNGKSYAFAKDSKLGGTYYTPYFYVGGSWKELKKDPALTYEDPQAPTAVGVFSIKPSPKIKVDANGQVDLDGLSTPQEAQNFHGFFSTLPELQAAVPKPIVDRSFAYVRHANGAWIGYQWKISGGSHEWKVMAPIGALSMLDNKEATNIPEPFYGIYRNNQWELDHNGIATLKPFDTKTKAEIVDSDSNVVTGEFGTIQLMAGKSYATVQGDKLYLNHPQRVITYTSDFEADHNKKDYEGNIFYDENSQAWMGWGIPKAAGAVDKKWTRIAHPHMSEEVKGLSKRNPAKSPSVESGIVGDSRLWDYNGFTYVEKDEETLPDEIKSICGGYITTSIQDKDAPEVTIPQNRMQTLIADQEGGATYIRRYLSTGSPGSATYWSPWVRTSFSKKDINAHEEDPAAHKKVFKYHRASSFTAKFSEFVNQIGPDSGKGTVRDDNCDLLVDNYGFSPSTDYIEVPYTGKFRIKGEIAFSGYKGNTTVTVWKIVLTIARKNQPGSYQLLRQFQHVHSKTSERYPPMFFSVEDQALEPGDKVYIKIQSSDTNALVTNHPNLYFVPLKSYFVVEDQETRSGSKIANTHKKHLANLNALGDIEVKAHHNEYDTTKAVRVYGDKVNKTPVEMTPVT